MLSYLCTMILFSFVVFTYLILEAFGLPSAPSPGQQDIALRDAAAGPPAINATAKFLDHNGLDITSSFKIMVYHQAAYHEPPSVPITNGTGNNLNDRQMTQFAQLVNACPANETFINSSCDPEAGGDSAMQKYVYTCRRTELQYSAITGDVIGQRPVYRIRNGHCQPFEICVTGHRPMLIAACVQIWVFDEWTIDKSGLVKPMLGGRFFNLDDLNIYSVMSGTDNSTPLELDKFNIDAWVDGESGNDTVQSQKCRDCYELKTDALQPNTNSLKVEATLLTAGAMAGILWLGLMSG